MPVTMSAALLVEYNFLPEIAASLDRVMAQMILAAAFRLAGDAKNAAPVDTGFLRSSIYVLAKTTSTYGQAMNPPEGASLLPAVPRPSSATEAIVAVGASYGIYQEMGTRHMAAQPYFMPAIQQAKVNLIAQMQALEAKLLAAGGL